MTIHACLLYQNLVVTAGFRLDESLMQTSRHIGIQMRDAHGDVMPQPYPDTDEMAELRHWNDQIWLINICDPPVGFTFQDVHPTSWQEAYRDRVCKVYDADTKRIVLAPGYTRLKNGRVNPDLGPDLKEAHIAFGGLRLWTMADGVLRRGIDLPSAPMAGDAQVLTKLKARLIQERQTDGHTTDI